MQKNIAGQKIGCQMVSATDGSAFTGSVTVAVTGDAGTQATGSVGSGACTHEGNGYHTYAPAQAETNYDLIAFTFIGTGAVPATVQVFTTLDTKINTIDDFLDTEIAAIKAKTDNLPSDPADASDIATATTTIAGYIDTEVAAIKAKTDLIPAAPAAVGDIPTAVQNADALLKRDWTSVTGEASRSVLNALRFIRNRFSTSVLPGSVTVHKEDDTTLALTKPLVTDADAEPIVEG